MNLRLALPKGEIQDITASLLADAGMSVADYRADSRAYRLKVIDHPGISVKVFQEKDIAIQVAIGNYDLGICRLDWVEELQAKYWNVPLLRITDLGYGERALFAACGRDAGITRVEELSASNHGRPVRLVSEYPNLTERFALGRRFRRFSVFSVWGAAEAYPPEHAEIAVLIGRSAKEIVEKGLRPLEEILRSRAVLIANRDSFKEWDMEVVLGPICKRVREQQTPAVHHATSSTSRVDKCLLYPFQLIIRLFLPRTTDDGRRTIVYGPSSIVQRKGSFSTEKGIIDSYRRMDRLQPKSLPYILPLDSQEPSELARKVVR